MARKSYVHSGANIKVVGLGGAGSNAISRMVQEQVQGVEFVAMNTDAQHLETIESVLCVQLDTNTSRGLGAGGDHKIGQQAAEDNIDEIKKAVAGADMVFITAGMGGGTGTGASPVVAEVARASGALTIAVVTKPFGFEGLHRMEVAEAGIISLMNKVDTLIIIPNDRLFSLCDHKMGVDGAFKMADEVLYHGVQAIAEVVTVPGLVNLDFADVRAIMKDAGPAWMSVGHGSGSSRATDAAKDALDSPLLDVSVNGAKGVLFNIAGSSDLTLLEVNDAAEVIKEAVDPDANVIFGVIVDPELDNEIRLTLIATGFATKPNYDDITKEKEFATLINDIKSEQELEVPAYLRQRYSLPEHQLSPNELLREKIQ